MAHDLLECVPFVVVAYDKGEPVFTSCAGIDVLRSALGTAVSVALKFHAICRPFDRKLSRRVECAFDHAAFEEMSTAGLLSLGEGHLGCEGGVHSRKRIAGATLNTRLIVGVASHPGEARHLFHRLRESDVVTPRT